MKFSIVTAVYNCEKYLSESIESVINQDIGFKENVQLILVDDGSTDNSKEIAMDYQKKFPENILVLSKENNGPGSARNFGLEYVKGDYVNFLDSDDKLSLDALSNVYSFFKNNDVDVVSIPIFFFERRGGEHLLNYKFKESRIIDLNESYDYPQLHISSSFIKSDSIQDLRFDEDLVNGEDALFLNKIILNKQKYGVLSNVSYWYRKRDDFSSIMDKSKNSTKSFRGKLVNFYLELINYSLSHVGEVPKFIQYLIAYDLNSMVIAENFKPDDDFMECFKQILFCIDVKIIADHRYLKKNVKSFLIYLKNNDVHIETDKNNVFLKSNDYIINRLHKHKLRLEKILFEEDIIHFEGYFSSNCDVKNIRIHALKNQEVYETTYNNHKPFKKFFGIEWEFYYTFEVDIPIEKDEECTIKFNVEISDVELNNRIIFKKEAKPLNSKKVIITGDKIIQFKNNTFYIFNKSLKNKLLLNLSIKS